MQRRVGPLGQVREHGRQMPVLVIDHIGELGGVRAPLSAGQKTHPRVLGIEIGHRIAGLTRVIDHDPHPAIEARCQERIERLEAGVRRLGVEEEESAAFTWETEMMPFGIIEKGGNHGR